MQPLEALLLHLVDDLALDAGGAGGGVAITGAELRVPIETRPGGGGRLLASLPRGRLATGFQARTGELRARMGRRDEEAAP